mgnify:CR=1 FL=1
MATGGAGCQRRRGTGVGIQRNHSGATRGARSCGYRIPGSMRIEVHHTVGCIAGEHQMVWRVPEVFASLVPEILLFEDHQDRLRAWRRALKRNRGRWVIAQIVVWTLFWPLWLFAASQQWLSGQPRFWFLVFAVLTAGAVAIWLSVRLTGPRIRETLREELLARGIPVCHECGYDMRGLSLIHI